MSSSLNLDAIIVNADSESEASTIEYTPTVVLSENDGMGDRGHPLDDRMLAVLFGPPTISDPDPDTP